MSRESLHELLSRIRWDRAFGQGDFVIGYQDRFDPEIIRVPLRQTQESADGSHALLIPADDEQEEARTVPLHRIVEVHKNGQLIWQRKRP